ncbi:MAG: integration host factor subunit beta [Deltaproteobacteria bacterium]|nr:integration host factor subunit beta [Deltaproteobacteria bacterium]
MTKRDLIEEVAVQYPRFSRRDAEVMVNAVFDSMTEALAKGERIEIRGFGSFMVKQREAREGRNPRTGALVSVAAKKVPLFKVGKELRLRVDGQPVTDANLAGDDTPDDDDDADLDDYDDVENDE